MNDLEALKAQWRAEGLTSFQVANRAADWQKAETNRRALGWWQNHELWLESGYSRSEVEEVALWRVYSAAVRFGLVRLARAATIMQSRPPLRPLRDVHAARGETLRFVELGGGLVRGVVVSKIC